MRRVALTVLFAMGAASAAALMTWRQPSEGSAEALALVPSERRAPEPPVVPAPPRVPAQTASLPIVTFALETTRFGPGGPQRSTQVFTRSHDRVRLALKGGRRQEWLFLQNAVYRDRAVGYLIDHDKREVQVHEESSLRSLMQVRGWMDVLTLRFDPGVLQTLRDTGERRRTGDATFKRYAANAPGRDGIAEVWWSEGLVLPLSLTVRASGVEVTSVVKGLTWNGDDTLLADPSVRFPSYKTVDPADANDHH